MLFEMMGRSIYLVSTEETLSPQGSIDFGTVSVQNNYFWSSYREKYFLSGAWIMAGYEGVMEKTPSEKMLIYHDFSPDLEAGETLLAISSVTSTRLNPPAGSYTEEVVLTDEQGFSGSVMHYGVKGGSADGDYKITIKVATDQSVGTAEGGVREVVHLLKVRNK